MYFDELIHQGSILQAEYQWNHVDIPSFPSYHLENSPLTSDPCLNVPIPCAVDGCHEKMDCLGGLSCFTIAFFESTEYAKNNFHCSCTCEAAITSQGDIPDTRNILNRIYASTGGDDTWVTSTNWGQSNISYCSYFGVGCNTNREVVSLFLPTNDLMGSFPTPILDLTGLVVLGLGSNLLTSTIPNKLYWLGSLIGADFTSNEFSG